MSHIGHTIEALTVAAKNPCRKHNVILGFLLATTFLFAALALGLLASALLAGCAQNPVTQTPSGQSKSLTRQTIEAEAAYTDTVTALTALLRQGYISPTAAEEITKAFDLAEAYLARMRTHAIAGDQQSWRVQADGLTAVVEQLLQQRLFAEAKKTPATTRPTTRPLP